MMRENFNMYPKNEGMSMPLCSAMDLTMKLGPLPMYVSEPKNTAPIHIALRSISLIPATTAPSVGRVNAVAWNTIAVGALSRNAERHPVEYTNCHGSVTGSGFCWRYMSAGVIVAKMPQKTHATSRIGVHENELAVRTFFFVVNMLMTIMKMNTHSRRSFM